MIKTTTAAPPAAPAYAMQSGQNDRMAGSMPVFGALIGTPETPAAPSAQTANLAEQPETTAATPPSEDSFGLDDIVDILNPLQHLPLVGLLYRNLTGDTISAAADILGGALYGGPVGAGFAIAGTVAKDIISGEAASAPTATALTNSSAHRSTTNPINRNLVAFANLREGFTPYNS